MITQSKLVKRLGEIPGLKPQVKGDAVAVIFKTDHYVDPDTGMNALLIILKLRENGEYLEIFVPNAWKIKGKNVDDFLKACMMIQWKTKMIQFEYHESDGEVRPIIEWPIEDGTVTTKQLHRAISGMQQLVDGFAPVLDNALATGKVQFPRTM